MTEMTKLRRRHAREQGMRAVQAVNDSCKYTKVGNNTSFTTTLRQSAYDQAHNEAQRAYEQAFGAAQSAFKAHPELR